MKYRQLLFPVLACFAAGITSVRAQGDMIEKAALGSLQLEFSQASEVTLRPGKVQLMQVDTLPDDRLQLRLPFRPNRLERLVGDGARVAAGDPIARVSGPELHHWLLEAELIGARFATAQQRYEQSRGLFESQNLSADLWQAISDRYSELRLAQHHVEHVLEWLRPSGNEGEPALLRAPAPGQVVYSALPATAEGELPILDLLSPGTLRLFADLDFANPAPVAALQTGSCKLEIAQREVRVSRFSSRYWSEPVNGCAPALPGAFVSGVPLYAFVGYAVPRAAVIRAGGDTLIAIESGDQLELLPVTIAGEDDQQYYVSSEAPLNGRQVLIRSTSAVQGVLLGLGQE